ncbi:MAG TPA: DUF92 domain-containing protein [Mucilaginibacter sp.]
MSAANILLALIITAGITYSITARKLTIMAALTGGLVAYIIYLGAGFTGVAIMTVFFILGSAATSWQRTAKLAFEDVRERQSGRTTGQVLANSGIPAVCGLLALLFPRYAYLFTLMMAAGFASATADTLSSELGSVYGRRFINIITLKVDERGLDGVISLEGTLIGVLGSFIIAIIDAIGFGWNIYLVLIVVAGTIGNLADSVMGALLERRRMMGNNSVNFLNTLIAALAMLLFYFIKINFT